MSTSSFACGPSERSSPPVWDSKFPKKIFASTPLMRVHTLSIDPLSRSQPKAAEGFARVFAEHATLVRRALRRLGVPEADVDDVSQEVFLVVHRRLPSYEGRSAFPTWVYGICVR